MIWGRCAERPAINHGKRSIDSQAGGAVITGLTDEKVCLVSLRPLKQAQSPEKLLPPPSPYHPSGSSQRTSPKHPVSCIEPGLAIRFLHDIKHVSVPFSQIIPPSPSPMESKRLFYTSVSHYLSRIQGCWYHLYAEFWCRVEEGYPQLPEKAF